MRSMFHCQARVIGSNASRPSSASAVRNWARKNGFPSVFSCTSCAKGRTRFGSQCIASATSWPTSSSRRGASTISWTRAPDLRIASSVSRGRRERVRGTALVVAVGADQQQVPHVRVCNQMLEEIEGRGVEPLQIIEEQGERVFRLCEHIDETPARRWEPILSVLWREVRNRWLRADDELQFRNEVDNERPIRVQCLPKTVAPTLELGLALAQQPADEALKGVSQRGLRDVAFVLVEFARRK